MKKDLKALREYISISLINVIARDCKAFNIPENRRNLKYNCVQIAVLF